mgnify:CR=1 FL=1
MITQSPPPAQPGPLAAADRVTNLDAIRGLSVLGILGGLLVGTIVTPVTGCGLYQAWKQAYGSNLLQVDAPVA